MNRIFKMLIIGLIGASLSSCFLFPTTVGYTEECNSSKKNECEYYRYSD